MLAPLRFRLRRRRRLLFVHGERVAVGAAGIRTHDSVSETIVDVPDAGCIDGGVGAWRGRAAAAVVADDDVDRLRVRLPLAQEVLGSVPELRHRCGLLPLVEKLPGLGGRGGGGRGGGPGSTLGRLASLPPASAAGLVVVVGLLQLFSVFSLLSNHRRCVTFTSSGSGSMTCRLQLLLLLLLLLRRVVALMLLAARRLLLRF